MPPIDHSGPWLVVQVLEVGLPERTREKYLPALVGVLDSRYRRVDDNGAVRYLWPSAFGYGSWEAVPDEARDATDEDFENFSRRELHRLSSGADP